MWLVHEPGLTPQCGHRRIIWMGRQHHAGVFGDRHDGVQKIFQTLPKLVVSGTRHSLRGCRWAVDHIPNHPRRHPLIQWSIHPDRFGSASRKGSFDPAGHPGDGKVIPKDRHAGAPDVADDCFQVAELLLLFGAAQEYIVPMSRIEILYRFEFQAGGIDLTFYFKDLLVGPQSFRIPGQAPTRVVADGLVTRSIAARRTKVVDQVNDQVGAATLPREPVMLLIQLVAV